MGESLLVLLLLENQSPGFKANLKFTNNKRMVFEGRGIRFIIYQTVRIN
jgi:hypothetical protein